METTVIACIKNRIGSGPSCAGSGSEAIAEALEAALREKGMGVAVRRIQCLGSCKEGPNMRIAPGGPMFHHLTLADVPRLVEAISAFLTAKGPS
ncbi:MAG: (2Fe-2S) ferredoxin domain-containing protein [Magnetococcales bacterium]|nr:(2Fe-2S) ferredoxin domain-containing protein [Magnetococcales bacterium]